MKNRTFAPDRITLPAELSSRHRQSIGDDVLRRMARHSARGLFGFPAAFLIIGAVSGDLWLAKPTFLVVLGLLLVVVVARGILVIRFDATVGKLGVRRWFRAFAILLLTTAALWVALVSWILDHGLDSTGFVALLITIAFMAHAPGMYAASFRLTLAYLLTFLVPIITILAQQTEPAAIGIAIGGLAFGLYNFSAVRSSHRDLWMSLAQAKMLEVRAEDLAAAEASLQIAHSGLERRVEERTADYRRVERELRRREQHYRQIFENAHDAIIIMRPEDEVLLEVNPRACELYGTSREELLGSSMEQRSADAARGRERIRETLDVGRTISFQTRQRRDDGEMLDIEVNASVIEYQNQTAILSINRDITERRRADAMQLAKEAAERSNRAKDEFLANVSHEIRTPMAGIIGLSGLLLKEELPTTHRRHVEIIADSAESLLQIIDDILDLSKLEAGRLSLEREAFSPRRLAERIGALLRPRATSKGLVLIIEVDDAVADWLLGVPSRLRQIVLNLVGNAIKFTPTGSVTLSIRQTPVTSSHGAIAGPSRLVFEVTDTGVGIAQDDLQQIFEPFTQVDPSSSREQGGSGLGLAISRRLAEALGGRLDVDSTVGGGSTFRLEVDVETTSEPRQQETTRFDSPRVLLAEDNPVNRLVISEQLEALGCRVEAVVDGEAALVRHAQHEYDLLLLDCQMPGLDGYETARRIRQHEASNPQSRLPIVAVTAHALPADRDKCLAAGMDDHLSKPFTEERLASTLRRWL